jgi:hypothetical protein
MDEMREEILSELGNHQLRRRGEQIHLNEIEQSLNREQEEEPDRDPIQQGGISRYECRVEQAPHDLRKCERDCGAAQQTNESDYESGEIRADSREQAAKRPW